MAEEPAEKINLTDLPEGEPPKGAEQLFFTNFARENTVVRRDGRIYGNWNSSFGAACVVSNHAYIQEASVISLNRVGRCDSGDTVIKAEHY